MNSQIEWAAFEETTASHLGFKKEDISESTDIYKDLGLDSLGVVSLGMKLYAVFKIKVPISEVSKIFTLGDMYRIINEYAAK